MVFWRVCGSLYSLRRKSKLGDGPAEASPRFICPHFVEPTAGNIDVR